MTQTLLGVFVCVFFFFMYINKILNLSSRSIVSPQTPFHVCIPTPLTPLLLMPMPMLMPMPTIPVFHFLRGFDPIRSILRLFVSAQVNSQPQGSPLKPNAVLYGAVIRACSTAGKWRLALELLEVRYMACDALLLHQACRMVALYILRRGIRYGWITHTRALCFAFVLLIVFIMEISKMRK